MTDIIEEKDVKKTRKTHQCFGCLKTIPIGSPAHMQVFNDGGIGRAYFHPACQEIINIMDWGYSDDITEGCVLEELRNVGFEGTPEEYVKWRIAIEPSGITG